MVGYKLSISVDPDKVKQFNSQGWKLCFASGVAVGGNTRYNVVARASSIAQLISIQWTDQYSISASQDTFRNGIQFTENVNPSDIRPGQSYTLPSSWTNGTVQNDPNAPHNGMRFINQTDGAAAVLSRRVNGVSAPIYFSQDAPLPKGTEDLTPLNKVKVWFSNQLTTGTMVTETSGAALEVDFTGSTSNKAQYGADGSWSLVTG